MEDIQEFKVEIKDFDQGITHKMHQLAKTQEEANEMALNWVRYALKSKNLEIA